jgi:hypothetical protein
MAFREDGFCQRLRRFPWVYIRTSHRFLHPRDYSSFVPLPHIQAQIDEASRSFTPSTVGIHVRRGDHSLSIAESPVELFEKRMKELVATQPATTFFLATDDAEVKVRLAQTFGDRILTRNVGCRRDRLDGIVNAVVDLYALARTPRILGSYQSSFGATAHYMSNNEFEILRQAESRAG